VNDAATPGSERSALRDATIGFVLAMVLIFLLGRIGSAVGFVAANLGAFVACVFLFVPHGIGKKRGQDLYDYGFRVDPIKPGLMLGVVLPLVAILPIFAVGFFGFYRVVCQSDALRLLAMPGKCAAWVGWHWPRLDWSISWGALIGTRAIEPSFIEFVLAQFIVTALPEELFFRGFLLSLLEKAWPPKRRLFGGGVGLALIVSSVAFALSHVVIHFQPHRLAVFFPGLLFGWMFAKTRSVLAGTVAHALCNIFLYLLEKSFFV
jgi:membrane protease YdiL (CAAX protease family)